MTGEKFTALLHNDSHADALDYFEGLRANGVRSVLNDGRDVQGREKKGGRIPLFMTLGRISDQEPRRFCAVLRDLTAWKRDEAELTEARRAAEMASAKKSDFLTKISHEIRTPMNAIIGFAEVMIEERLGAIGNAKVQRISRRYPHLGQHVVSLVNDCSIWQRSKRGAWKCGLRRPISTASFPAVSASSSPRPCPSRAGTHPAGAASAARGGG